MASGDYEALVGAVVDILTDGVDMLNSMNGGELSVSIFSGSNSSGGQLALTGPPRGDGGLTAAKADLVAEHGSL